MDSPSDTIAALATPVGTSAIAVVRASGPNASKLAVELLGEAPPPRVARHVDIRGRDGTLIDDVLITFFAAPNSYTGEDSVEVSCHGNPFIAQKIMQDMLARGCRAAGPGEFTQRAFLNGRMDLSQAEAVMDLIHARSERALAAANRQLRGSLGRRMEELIHGLLAVLAALEAYIDFPDEDLPPENRAALLRQLEQLQANTARLLATNRYGQILRDGVRTVIIGQPNVGKSSLLNRLVGRERALVSPEPGTTRDYLEEWITVGPHVLRLVDTAGLNPSPSALEQRGMVKSLEQAADADLFLWVIDAAAPLPDLPDTLRLRLTPSNTLVVLNKSDLPAIIVPPAGLPHVRVSALSGTGLDELTAKLAAAADALQTDVGEDWVAINARHADALERASRSLQAAHDGLAVNIGNELVSSNLRGSLAAFGEISGRIDNEAVLDQLFSTFCIGK